MLYANAQWQKPRLWPNIGAYIMHLWCKKVLRKCYSCLVAAFRSSEMRKTDCNTFILSFCSCISEHLLLWDFIIVLGNISRSSTFLKIQGLLILLIINVSFSLSLHSGVFIRLGLSLHSSHYSCIVFCIFFGPFYKKAQNISCGLEFATKSYKKCCSYNFIYC